MDIQQLYTLYIHDVYRYLLSLCKDESLAEDLTQDTFMKAYSALEKSPAQAMKPWLLKIAYHTFIDFVRRNKKVNIENPDYFSMIPSSEFTDELVQKELEKDELYKMLEQLKPIQKRAILLCDIQGYSYKEAATILSIKENTLKTHIFRGRGKLRQLYKKGSVEE
ncbi:sigma-70 family RNA polymerase sigma factor [Bacillus sp. AK128]